MADHLCEIWKRNAPGDRDYVIRRVLFSQAVYVAELAARLALGLEADAKGGGFTFADSLLDRALRPPR